MKVAWGILTQILIYTEEKEMKSKVLAMMLLASILLCGCAHDCQKHGHIWTEAYEETKCEDTRTCKECGEAGLIVKHLIPSDSDSCEMCGKKVVTAVITEDNIFDYADISLKGEIQHDIFEGTTEVLVRLTVDAKDNYYMRNGRIGIEPGRQYGFRHDPLSFTDEFKVSLEEWNSGLSIDDRTYGQIYIPSDLYIWE